MENRFEGKVRLLADVLTIVGGAGGLCLIARLEIVRVLTEIGMAAGVQELNVSKLFPCTPSDPLFTGLLGFFLGVLAAGAMLELVLAKASERGCSEA